MIKKTLLALLVTSFVTYLVGCTNFSIPYHYRQQGNWIEKEKIALVKKGMTKQEVADILGTPVYDNPFDLSRWDYVYTLDETGSAPTRKHLLIEFSKERVTAIKQSS